MLNLNGLLSVEDIRAVNEYTNTRFADTSILLTPEALTLYEEGYLPREEIRKLCEEFYGMPLYEPHCIYVPEEVTVAFRGTGVVPVAFEPMKKRITVVAVRDFAIKRNLEYAGYKIDIYYTTLNYYLEVYNKTFGMHPVLREVPAKQLYDSIIREALKLGAIDITIDSLPKSTRVFYNVRKRRVNSSKIFSHEFIYPLLDLLTIKSPMDTKSGKPKDLDIDINEEYRGRVQINPNMYGFSITIRLVPNRAFNAHLNELNLGDKTVEFFRRVYFDPKPGLNLIVGQTMSGKNTTILAALCELASGGNYKIVSIEMPVEQTLPDIIQINNQKEEEFKANAESMIKANPDILYVTEIRDSIGRAVFNITNTGKRVFSTAHANSVSAAITRLMEITGLEQDRIIQSLRSICYQELKRDEEHDSVYPYNRFVEFTDDFKFKLYGKSLGEVIHLIEEEEDGD